MIGFFGSLEIETGMGEKEVSYTQFVNSRDFVFCFEGRRRKTVEERKRICILFVCQRWRSGIWRAGLGFGIAL